MGPFTLTQLIAFIQCGDIVTVMGVPHGSGIRMGIDRNSDGILNGDAPAAPAKAVRQDIQEGLPSS